MEKENKQCITKSFNIILAYESIPTEWNQCLLIPIFKGKCKKHTDISHYRPITLLSILYKLFEKTSAIGYGRRQTP